MGYDKDEIKNNITIEQMYEFLCDLGAEPLPLKGDHIVCRTICHNPAGHGSYKLYYYDNSKLFRCYTDCDTAFDIFELVQKQKKIFTKQEWSLADAISFVAAYYGIAPTAQAKENDFGYLDDWGVFERYTKSNEQQSKVVSLEEINPAVLQYLPSPRFIEWEQEGIADEVMKKNHILYDPVNEGIVIPHYDIYGRLVGIRERTLCKDQEQRGKYKPAIINGRMFNHALSFNLYNLNNSKTAIKISHSAIVFESEKSALKYASYFGCDNDISVACCGSTLTSYQFNLLLNCGAREVIIAFDRQFQQIGDNEFKTWTEKLKGFHKKFGRFAQISFMFDKHELLGYKDSPIDRGSDTFLQLYAERIML